MREPSNALLNGRRDLEDIDGVTIIEDLTWNEDISKWAIKLGIELKEIPHKERLRYTKWYVHIDNNYPSGRIKFYPAADGGITCTYHHQSFNSYDNGRLWRNGDLCLDTQLMVLNRGINQIEPTDGQYRLYWTCLRAVNWLYAAYNKELLYTGDFFELPVFPSKVNGIVVFNENNATYQRWKYSNNTYGFVDFVKINGISNVLLVKNMVTYNQKIRRRVSWGSVVVEEASERGLWVFLRDIPVIEEWQVPQTFGGLVQVCNKQDINIIDIIREAAPNFRDGKAHVLLIGFPIPNKVGECNVQVVWQALKLPILSQGKLHFKGFMNKESSYWINDKINVLKNEMELDWVKSENWNEETLLSRGRIDKSLRKLNVLLIGCGALGSNIAENLVRAGISSITIFDGDNFQAGNLTRHTLTITNIRESKAEELCKRLQSCNPLVNVKFIDAYLSYNNMFDIDINKYDLIVECTADNQVLDCLSRYTYKADKHIISASISKGATRLYLYSTAADNFKIQDFYDRLSRFTQHDLSEYTDDELPREGIGCWHPVFPAKSYDMTLMSSIAAIYIEEIITTNLVDSNFSVYQKKYKDAIFLGVQKIDTDIKNG